MTEKSDIEKLRVLLPHWIEHSHSHQKEFTNWSTLVKKAGHEEVAQLIEQAVRSMQETDRLLSQALEKVGGAAHGNHHHHHHHD